MCGKIVKTFTKFFFEKIEKVVDKWGAVWYTIIVPRENKNKKRGKENED